jgi:hypothetical protein
MFYRLNRDLVFVHAPFDFNQVFFHRVVVRIGHQVLDRKGPLLTLGDGGVHPFAARIRVDNTLKQAFSFFKD